MNFASDNTVGASASVMASLMAANDGSAAPYGADAWTARVTALMSEMFEREVTVALVSTGTAANALALACLVEPFGAVLTHAESHISCDENGAVEFFSHGARLVGVGGIGCKLDPADLAATLAAWPDDNIRQPMPQALSITQATESGQVYTPAEVAALTAVARSRGLRVHMDGARFGNAVASLGCSPAEITWKAGVDILSFGATKNGAWAAEAVVLFDGGLNGAMARRLKRSGHVLSKGRFLAAQWEALLTDGHWLDLARTANARATRLAQGLGAVAGVRLGWPCAANEVFAIMPLSLAAHLKVQGAQFHPWSQVALPASGRPAAGEGLFRFVCSFATSQSDVDRLVALASASVRAAA